MKWHGKGKNPPISGTAFVLARDRHETNPPDSSLLNNLTILDAFLKPKPASIVIETLVAKKKQKDNR
jgi:hypothetical protein